MLNIATPEPVLEAVHSESLLGPHRERICKIFTLLSRREVPFSPFQLKHMRIEVNQNL